MNLPLRILFWLGLAVAVALAAMPHPPHMLDGIWDKAQHMGAFAVLALACAMAYPQTPLLRIGERLSFLGAMIELVQSIPAVGRDCDIRDWLADTFAIAVTLALVAMARRRRQRR
ncbi:MAG: hypothetical protein PGN09_06800 [Sphingomonas fennica]